MLPVDHTVMSLSISAAQTTQNTPMSAQEAANAVNQGSECPCQQET